MKKKGLVLPILLLTLVPITPGQDSATNRPPVATNALVAGPATAAPVAVATPTNEPTIVTSEHLQADYLHNVGTFDGNVLAVDPRMTVRADKMTVFFGGTNLVTEAGTNTTRTVQKIIADGAVVGHVEERGRNHRERRCRRGGGHQRERRDFARRRARGRTS